MNMPRAARGRVPLSDALSRFARRQRTHASSWAGPRSGGSASEGCAAPGPRASPVSRSEGERVERARDTAVPVSPDNRGVRTDRYRRQLAGAAYIGAGHGRPGSAVPVQGGGLRPGGVSHGPHIGGRAGCDPRERAGCRAGRNGPRGAVPVRDERAGRAVAGLWAPKTYAIRRYS
jgi:hypothetical protein